jgi:tetratricopeptide (TPR) repeat protein
VISAADRRLLSGVLALLLALPPALFLMKGLREASLLNLLRDGEGYYASGDYDESLKKYHEAEARGLSSPILSLGIGNALYRKGYHAEAVGRFVEASTAPDADIRLRGLYNMGNAYYLMNDHSMAVAAYKEALRIGPSDKDAKNNLELALRMMKGTLEKGVSPGGETPTGQDEGQGLDAERRVEEGLSYGKSAVDIDLEEEIGRFGGGAEGKGMADYGQKEFTRREAIFILEKARGKEKKALWEVWRSRMGRGIL